MRLNMNDVKILIISGGFSDEREVSLNTGKGVHKALSELKYSATLADLVYKDRLVLTDISSKIEFEFEKNYLAQFDLVFNALHGEFGEDGQIQELLDELGVRYTHSNAESSSLGFDKFKSSQLIKSKVQEVKIPESFLLKFSDIQNNELTEFTAKVGFPLILKPNAGGSSLYLHKVETQSDLKRLLSELPKNRDYILQKFIKGREFTCPVFSYDGSSGSIKLPAGEILAKNELFDYDQKYSADNSEIEIFPIPDNIYGLNHRIQAVAELVHQTIGANGLSRSDFILDKKGDLYFLEINTQPGLTPQSLCPKSALAVGLSYSGLIEKIVQSGLR
jgi:D-alanine-D-alanine ligase